MSWWKKLFGGKRDSAAPASFDVATPFPVAVEIVPGELSARVHLHEIRAAGGLVPCWSYVSEGLRAHQQREVVFTLRREAGEAAGRFPDAPFTLFRTLHRLAAQGQRVTVGGHSELGATRFFGHHVLYADAQPLDDVELPSGCLAVLLVNDEELRGVRELGCARVLARMGHAARHFPFQTWNVRGRRGIPLASTFEETLLSKIGVRIGGDVVVTLVGNRVTLGLRRRLQAQLRDANLPDAPVAFLALRDPAANAALVWEPGQGEPTAISPPGSDGSRVAGAFAVVLGERPYDRGELFEDGFVIELTNASWARFRGALREGTDLEIPATSSGKDFALTWRADIYADVPISSSAARGGGAVARSAPPVLPGELDHVIVLLMPEADLGARAEVDGLAAQIQAINAEVAGLYARGEIRVAPIGVFVAVKPNRRVKIWAEGIEGSLASEDAALIEQRASAVAAPDVRGAIAYVCAFPRKGTHKGGPPPMPQAWKDAARTAGTTLMIPDGMLAAVWPD